MIVFYWIIGFLAGIGIVLVSIGAYEFYVEDKKDRASYNRLHLKNFNESNNGK